MKKIRSWFSREGSGEIQSLDKKKVSIALLVPAIFLTTIVPAVMGTKSFTTLYQRHITYEVESIETIARDFGVLREQQIK